MREVFHLSHTWAVNATNYFSIPIIKNRAFLFALPSELPTAPTS